MRLFIATTFPSAILRELELRVAPLRPRLPRSSWVRPETQHLTLAFLGEQEPHFVDRLTPLLEQSLANTWAFQAMLSDCGFFPNERRARVGWIGVEPAAPLAMLASSVHEVVRQVGVTLDREELNPHLTLVRMRDPWPPPAIELFTSVLHDYRSATFVVDRVTLFASELRPRGAVHTVLHEVTLRTSAIEA